MMFGGYFDIYDHKHDAIDPLLTTASRTRLRNCLISARALLSASHQLKYALYLLIIYDEGQRKRFVLARTNLKTMHTTIFDPAAERATTDHSALE